MGKPSLRANGSRERAPDDRLREAIHWAAKKKNGLLRRFAPRNDDDGTAIPFTTHTGGYGSPRAAGTTGRCTSPSTSLRPLRRQKKPRRAVDDLVDALERRRGGGLEHERQKQRGLAHLDELRRRELAVVDREIVRPYMRPEIIGETADGLVQHMFIKTPADLGHPLRNRHHGADRRAAARPAQHQDIGAAEFPKRALGVARGIEIERDLALFERHFLDDCLEQPVLVGEIDVERALGNAAGAGDLAHAGAVKAEVHEYLARAVQNLAAFCAFLLADEVQGAFGGCNHWFSFSGKIPHLRRAGMGFSPYGPSIRMYL